MDRLLRALLKKLIRAGNLRVTTTRGSSFTLGDGTGPPAAIRFTTRAAERGILIDPELRFGEAYMDGRRRAGAQRNVAHHYDLDGRLYGLFLDADRQYSCAYFERPGQSLDDPAPALRRNTEELARAFPRPPRRGRETL